MQALLSRFSLKIQIGSLVALSGLVLAILMTVLLAGQSAADRANARAAKEAEIGGQAEVMDRALLNARRHEKDFQLRKDAKYVSANAESLGAAQAALDAMAAAMGDGDARRQQIDTIRKGLATYADAFRAVADGQTRVGLNETVGLLGTLRGSVHEIETILGSRDDLRLTTLMLMMRRHEKDFLARLDSKYVDELGQRVAEFEKALPVSAVPVQDRPIILDRLANYHRDFKALADGSLAVVANGKVLSETYAGIEPAIQSLLTSALKEMDTARKDAKRIEDLSGRMMTLVMLGGFTFLVVVGIVIARSIYAPIIAMTDATTKMAEGDLTVSVPGLDRGDELGAMAKAVQVFKDNSEAKVGLERLQASEQAAKARRQDELDQLYDLFGKSMTGVFGTVSTVSTEMSQAAGHMLTTASDIDTQVGLLLSESEHTTDNVRKVSAATQQLTASATEIEQQISTSAGISDAAVTQASAAIQKVSRLREAAGLIESILSLIQVIAGQTNLLALNATIEAARAGEAGKGFAVVASEVKTLANQTGQATSQIGSQIAMIQTATEEVSEAIETIGSTIRDLHGISVGVAAAARQQGAATRDIAAAVAEVANSTTTVTTAVQNAQTAAAQGRGHAINVGDIAGKLSEESDSVRTEITDLLDSLKSIGDGKSFCSYDVDLGCTVVNGGTTTEGRIKHISSGAVLFHGQLDTVLGTRVEIRIDGIAEAIRGRAAGLGDGGGTFFQLPMDPAHLAKMQTLLTELCGAVA